MKNDTAISSSIIHALRAPRAWTLLASCSLLGLPLISMYGCSSGGDNASKGEPVVAITKQALTTCTTLTPTDDAMISNPPKNQNYGSHPLLRVGGNDESLLKFNLSSIPAGSVINSATLTLYVNGSAGDNLVNIHPATSAWSAATVSYASFNQQYANAVAGIIDPSSSTAFKSASITGLVADWANGAQANEGVLLETTDSKKTIFVSSEGAAGFGPTLQVCYTTPPVNHCASNPCVHGDCQNNETGYTCSCAPGWTGTNCDENINDCDPNPCYNGGTCTDAENGYSCACAPGYTGTNCEVEIDECASNPCVGGICTDLINAYACVCDPGWTGTNCEVNIDECAGEPCQNGGTCTDGVNGYTCDCATGFTGTNCEINIDDCATAPCQNGGACVDGINSYNCSCLPGFEGTNCETNIDECAGAPCLNGGTCTDGENSYSCACAAGYTGTNCEIDINECASNPCVHGSCVDGVNSYSCNCQSGWSGTNCDVAAS